MRDLFPEDWKPNLKKVLLGLDAWVDFSLFRGATGAREGYERFSTFMDRFHVAGWKRWTTELFSEGATLGTVGLILMLALAIPAFRETSDDDWLKKSELAVTFLDRYGNEVGSRGIRHNDSIPLDQFPDHLIKAVLATEDRRFYDHFGIDIGGTLRAFVTNARAGGVVQGGSSLTQQLAKNLFLSNERTLERKVKEAFLAMWLEANLSKQEILKLYLDRAYMGGGNFGVEAASEFYFGKSVKDVNLAEAALLAGLFKAPARYAPHINLPAARARANEVLTNMVQAGFVTEGQVIGARRRPADVVERADGTGAPDYFLDWAFDQVKKLNLPERTLTVRTTVDLSLQKEADEAVESTLRESGEAYRVKQAALVAVDPDGAVRAMVGGRDYGESQFNRATDALRQPGSSFKPFVYATAMLNGYTPKSIVQDSPICIGTWCPKNYSGGYSGPVSLTTALVKSINIIPVRLAQAIGRDKIVETAHRMGITTELKISRSLPLGAAEVTVLDMAGAYLTIQQKGMQVEPRVIRKITQNDSVLVDDRPKSTRVIDRSVAEKVNYALQQVVDAGSGTRAALPGQAQVWGKTGTTDLYGDAWFVGCTRQLTTAVWMGYPEGQSKPLYNIHGERRVSGGSLPAQIFKRFMAKASPPDPTPPDKVPDLSGKTPAPVATVLSSGTPTTSAGSSGSSSASTSTTAPADEAPPTTVRQSSATVPPATVPTPSDPVITTPTAPATTAPRPRTTFTVPTIPSRP